MGQCEYEGRWQTVRAEVANRIGWAILNRPEKRTGLLRKASLLSKCVCRDVAAAARVVRRLGDLALSHPEIQEADINPLVVYPEEQGALALDALLSVQ